MILAALFVGVIVLVAAIRNSQGALFSALYQDVPGFVVWGAAIFAVGAVGFIPGLKPISRGLLALVIVALVLNNYTKILSGFQAAWTNPPTASPGGTTAGTNASGLTGNTGTGMVSGLTGGTETGSDLLDAANAFSGVAA